MRARRTHPPLQLTSEVAKLVTSATFLVTSIVPDRLSHHVGEPGRVVPQQLPGQVPRGPQHRSAVDRAAVRRSRTGKCAPPPRRPQVSERPLNGIADKRPYR